MSKTAVRSPCLLALAVVGLASAEASCDAKCGASDSVAVLDTRDGVYLVYRVSGAQDKMEFFEAYRSKPEFDSCGSTQTPVIASEPYQRSQGLLRKLEWHGNRLEIVHTHHASESIEPSQARLSH
jgi:hypothetical protein